MSVVVHDLEQKRVDCLKTQEKLKKEKEKKSKSFKVNSSVAYIIINLLQSPDQLEKEKNDSKWETSKVNNFEKISNKPKLNC